MSVAKNLHLVEGSATQASACNRKATSLREARLGRPLTSETDKLNPKQRRLWAGEQAEFARLLDRLVARRIRARWLQQYLIQQQLAEKVGVASQQIHKYENGISRITAGWISPIADALDFSVDAFFITERSRNTTPMRKASICLEIS